MLSEQARISVITCAPYEGYVFTLYGHAAFRVLDPEQNIDCVFNYGIFNFSESNFILRFALGQTDYKLEAYDYLSYIVEYQMRGSEVTEQILNLSEEDKNMVWLALIENAKPENKIYRYNFFFDNCATRLPAVLEANINGEIIYHGMPEQKTFRDMINYCTRNHSWLTFGCDLVLGSPTDRIATPHEMMFLPSYLEESLDKASIYDFGREERPLVEKKNVIEAVSDDEEQTDILNTVFTPLVCSWLLFFLTTALTIYGYYKKRAFIGFDIFIFTLAGIAGVLLFFLCFISEHPSIWPNWSVIWIHPFHLFGAVLFCIKKWKKAAYCYHFINFAALSLMLAGWYFIPQHMNIAFIPLVATLWLRSGYGIYRYKQQFG